MSELQAEQAPVDNDNIEAEANTEPQLNEVESESAPEKVTFSEAQQKVIDDMAGKKTFKIRERRR